MITMLSYGFASVYFAGLVVVTGLAWKHERKQNEPDYVEALSIAAFWPLLFAFWIYMNITYDPD